MILDTYFEVFVWVGKNANAVEKKGSLEAAMEYIKTDPSGRTVEDTCIMQVKQGFEPTNFRCHFHAWDDDMWSKGMSYEELKAKLGSEAEAVDALQSQRSNNASTAAADGIQPRCDPRGLLKSP